MRFLAFGSKARLASCFTATPVSPNARLRWSRGIHESESLPGEDSLHKHSRPLGTKTRSGRCPQAPPETSAHARQTLLVACLNLPTLY